MLTTATPDKPHAFFSLEMPGRSIVQRMACAEAGVPLFDVQRNRVSQSQYDSVIAYLRNQRQRGILIDDGVATMSDIMFRCMSMPVRPAVVWIDYVELVQMGESLGRDDLNIANVYIMAKQIAKALDCHVVVLSQLDPSVDSREDKWPTMRDLVRSSAGGKYADQVVLICRPEYYLSRGETFPRLLSPSDIQGVAYLILAKSRNGPPATKKAAYNAPLMMFSEYIGDEDDQSFTVGPQFTEGRNGGFTVADLESE